MPKSKKSRSSKNIHAPLGQQIVDDDLSKKFARQKKVISDISERDNIGDSDGEEVLDEKSSRKILALAEEQVGEEERRIAERVSEGHRGGANRGLNSSRGMDDDDDDDDDYDKDDDNLAFDDDDDDDNLATFTETSNGGYVSVSGPGLSEEEERIVKSMNPESQKERRTLADMIMEKIAEKEGQLEGGGEHGEHDDEEEEVEMFPPKVVEVYTGIGTVLSRYTAGKLPKAFKVIPSLSNWEDVLYLTRPDKWTPQAMFAATRIFSSNLNPAMAQRFYNLILLDSVRADILENKTLNYHYYMSLKKALYKPSAFYKGILLPLCKSGCTLREAAIVSSVLAKVSIPVHHSAVALHKLGSLPYSGASSVFIKTLLNKKYSLPMPVIEGLVQHFKKSATVGTKEGGMPVLWHQSMLAFAERYKDSINKDGKNVLKACCKRHFHKGITPAVRRELFGYEVDETKN